jgi:hypothetical protein
MHDFWFHPYLHAIDYKQGSPASVALSPQLDRLKNRPSLYSKAAISCRPAKPIVASHDLAISEWCFEDQKQSARLNACLETGL